MKSRAWRLFTLFFRYQQQQPVIIPKAGQNPTKTGYGVPYKIMKARRKALRLRQKLARRANRK